MGVAVHRRLCSTDPRKSVNNYVSAATGGCLLKDVEAIKPRPAPSCEAGGEMGLAAHRRLAHLLHDVILVRGGGLHLFAAVNAGAQAAAEEQRGLVRVVVQRVKVLGGVVLGLPVKVEAELLARLERLLAHLLRAQVLLLDQQQLLFALAVLCMPGNKTSKNAPGPTCSQDRSQQKCESCARQVLKHQITVAGSHMLPGQITAELNASLAEEACR